MITAFVFFTAGIAALATIQPDKSTNAIIFSGLAGLGFGGPLILVITGVQLSTPPHLIATATSVTTASRAVAATVFTAIFSAAYSARLEIKVPKYVAKAALDAGLPGNSLSAFLKAFVANQPASLRNVPGLSTKILAAASAALKQAEADSLRVVFIIAAPFGALACVACIFLSSLQKSMNYCVDAPIENLRAKAKIEPDGIAYKLDDVEGPRV